MSAQDDIVTRVVAKQERALDEPALRTIFSEARTARGYLAAPVAHQVLRRAVELAEFGPTSGNGLPLRIVFVESATGKARLLPALSPGNAARVTAAPVTAICAADLRFYEYVPRLSPQSPDISGFEGNPDRARDVATLSATLQGAYFILAARSLGLDVGPMGGFDKAKVDAEFFPDGRLKSLFLANVGYADDAQLYPRNPRLAFDEVATIV